MFRWFKKKCTKKHSKRLRTSSIGDWTRNNDYTSHPDTNIYHEIDDTHITEAYAVTSIEDLLDMNQPALTEVCPLCRQYRYGPNRNCKCFDQTPASPFKIRQDLTDDDDFSWLEYDFKGSSKSSLHRSRSEIRKVDQPRHKISGKSDDSCSSGYYETDDSCDDVTISPVYRPIPALRANPRLPVSPSLAPKMGCKIIKRSQSAVNPKRSRLLRRSKSDYLNPMKIVIEDEEMSSAVIDSVLDTVSGLNSQGKQLSDDEDDIFDHFYSNVCIDINNLEIPKLRKSSYRSRSHGQNRLLNDLLKQNHDKQNFTGVRK
ncbi:hypothetical protein LOTGIDRAFT_163883 [Lottia gigantea]|uniref:Uncharacterized protein n=1 Tax=Lottia gigantea TaxID=225164 RepID=V4A1V7_LOTGI|nr:hypothetical protein LOTGIDRAFT_163883 [Lottia gigantea]ESO90662.1 hypothetical protein LOTGIDRAFT_163883 [Lottia gigantea]